MTPRTPRTPTALLTVLLTGLLTIVTAGCSPLPEAGPVETAEAPAPTVSAAPFDFNPPGPVEGAGRAALAAGFLRALQATPVRTQVAESFLTDEAAAAWRPEQRTIVYSGQHILARRGDPRDVAIRLDSTFELDRTGRWAGTAPGAATGVQGAGGADRTVWFRFARQDGEWRIAALPDAMVIPETHFEARYREYSLPFFDATASVLVAEPVYLPWGVQAPTLLVEALLSGPSVTGRSVVRTFFPASTRLGVGVPVRDDGVAEVPLSRHVLDLGAEQLDLAMAQLAWTLGQVGEISGFRVTVDGTPLDLPDGTETVDVDGWPEYSPSIASASTDLFGIRDESVVQVVGDSEIAAATLPPRLRRARSLAVDLAGQQFALVTRAGDSVVLLQRSAEDAPRPTTAYQGTDLLRPMWDHTGRLWLVDRTGTGPEVLVAHFGRVRRIPAPGLPDQVVATALSRDGTRLVAAVRGDGTGGDRLVVMRVVRQASGEPVRLTRPQPLSTAQPLRRVVDVGWRDATTTAVLTRPSPTTSEVVLASADGSSGPIDLDAVFDVLFEGGVAVAASPGDPLALVVAARDGGLHALDAQGRWDLDAVPTGLRLPVYVG